jgi:signal transduction histidine kinase
MDNRFLAEASRVLSSSQDFEATLRSMAALLVPALGQYCIIDVVEEDDELRRVVIHGGHGEEGQGGPALREALRLPPKLQQVDHPVVRTLRQGQTEVIPAPDWSTIFPSSPSPQEMIGGPRALLLVPLCSRGRTLGVITLISAPSCGYDPDMVALVEDLAYRGALAADNARLYTESQQAAAARDHVIAMVSHDLRNPLTVISMVATHLSREVQMTDPQRMKFGEQIQRSTERMNRLIQDILDVTRIEAGRLSLERKPYKVGPLVSEALETLRPLAAARSMTLSIEPALADVFALPDVFADRERVLQVFSNLVGNAIKFTPRGGHITLTAAAVDGRVRFSVRDSGPGISEDDRRHLFDRFWQARRTSQKSTGLGLVIAKGVVEGLGGQIWAESEVGHGSTFYFTLPVE